MNEKPGPLEEQLAQQNTQCPGAPIATPPGWDSSWVELLSDPGDSGSSPSAGPQGASEEANLVGKALGPDGRYQIVECIGEGGMGIVYLAADRNLHGALVAIKTPRRKLLRTPTLRARFELEFQALIELNHPHICRVTDTGSFDGVPFVVLQYLSGGDLADNYFRKSPQSKPRDASSLMSWLPDIAEALDFIHQKDYVHRDIKPENILFDQHGHALLGDFGIVRAWKKAQEELHSEGLTQCGSWLGTPGYIAPEVILGQTDYDGRADIYSLAAVVYLFLTGKPPFAGRDVAEIRSSQIAGRVAPANVAAPQVPEAVARVLQRALATDPAQRPATAGQFVAELRAAFEPVTAEIAEPPVHALPRASSNRTRRAWSWLAIPVALVAVAALGWSPLKQMLIAVPPKRPQPTPFAPPQPKPDPQTPPQPTARTPGQAALVEQHFQNAQKLLKSGEFDSALQEINAAIALDEGEARLFSLRGEILESLDELRLAAEEYSQAIGRQADPVYFARRGLVRLALGENQAAEEDFTVALSGDPEIADYFGYRGLARLAQDEQGAAADDFAQALQLGSDAPGEKRASWHSGRGAALAASDPQAALEDANAALKLEPHNAKHLRNRAFIHEKLNNFDAAAADRREAEKLENAR